MATVNKKDEQKVVVEQENCEEEINELNFQARELEAKNIIKNHMMASLGFSIVSIPLVDLVGLTGVQLNMLRRLSNLYGQKFTKEWGKKSIASLLSGGITIPIAVGLSSLVKFIPIVGQAAGVISMATTSAALTYAIGRVFVRHFEEGGTFLTFDSNKVRDYFREEFEKGKEIAQNMKKTEKAAA